MIGNGVFRCVAVLLSVAAIWHADKVPGTNAGFSDAGSVFGTKASAGIWIPTLRIDSVSPAEPDGDNGYYRTTPCIRLESSGLTSGTASVYYAFSEDGDLRDAGTVSADHACIPVPEGEDVTFRAVSINDANDRWRSQEIRKTFSVDTECPRIDLEHPEDYGKRGRDGRGFGVRASVRDDHPDRYRVTFRRKGGDDPNEDRKDVRLDGSFSHDEVYRFDADGRRGRHVIRIEAWDRAGNVCARDEEWDAGGEESGERVESLGTGIPVPDPDGAAGVFDTASESDDPADEPGSGVRAPDAVSDAVSPAGPDVMSSPDSKPQEEEGQSTGAAETSSPDLPPIDEAKTGQ